MAGPGQRTRRLVRDGFGELRTEPGVVDVEILPTSSVARMKDATMKVKGGGEVASGSRSKRLSMRRRFSSPTTFAGRRHMPHRCFHGQREQLPQAMVEAVLGRRPRSIRASGVGLLRLPLGSQCPAWQTDWFSMLQPSFNLLCCFASQRLEKELHQLADCSNIIIGMVLRELGMDFSFAGCTVTFRLFS